MKSLAAPCPSCGQPSDDDVCALAAEFRRHYPEWSSRRCFDRAYIAAAKGAKPSKCVAALSADQQER